MFRGHSFDKKKIQKKWEKLSGFISILCIMLHARIDVTYIAEIDTIWDRW